MTIKRTPDSEPGHPARGNLADVITEGGDEQKSNELSRDPAQRQRSEAERDVDDTDDIRRRSSGS